MACVRMVCSVASEARWMGRSGFSVSVSAGSVRSLSWMACLSGVSAADRGHRREGGGRTPRTIRVPRRVMCPFTISFRGVLTTSVLPGSVGARRA